MEHELKPCPFCGTPPKTAENRAGGIYIYCPNEDCVQPEIESSDAIQTESVYTTWNTRVKEGE